MPGTPDPGEAASKSRRPQVGLFTALIMSVVAATIPVALFYPAVNKNAPVVSSLDNPSVSGMPASAAPAGSVQQVAAAVLPKVISIEVATIQGVASGSGSIISSDGLVLTNNHVVAGANNNNARILVTLNDGSTHTADFIASDPATDIAVIKIQNVSQLPVMEFADSSQLHVGQPVVAVGSPLGLSATVTTGIVSALNRPVRAADGGGESSLIDAVQTDAAINPGNSGGPLVDMNGNLVGMNSVIASLSRGGDTAGSIGLGFAIPANFAKRVAHQLATKGRATQPMLGIRVTAPRTERGALVAGIEPGGAADHAGLITGDVIIRLNERLIDSPDALIAAVRSQEFGDTVTLQARRQGEADPVTVEATLSTE
nr:trypsin-like peptidase domain-containing protein [Corynebacterium caspium]